MLKEGFKRSQTGDALEPRPSETHFNVVVVFNVNLATIFM